MLLGSYVLQSKEYYEDSTQEEIDLLQARVTVIKQHVIYFKEIELMTPFSIQILFDEAERIIDEGQIKAIVFDLRETVRPNYELRQILYKRFCQINDKVGMYSFCTGKNTLINIAAKFFMNTRQAPTNRIHFFKSIDEALNKANEFAAK